MTTKRRARIRSLADLEAARMSKAALHCPGAFAYRKPIPAAWLINLPGRVIGRLIDLGLFVYKKKTP